MTEPNTTIEQSHQSRQEYNRAYYQTHKEEIKRYRVLNKERDDEQRRARYERTKEKTNTRKRERYKEFGNPYPNRTFTPEQKAHQREYQRNRYRTKLRHDPIYTEKRRRYTQSEKGKTVRREAEKRRRIKKRAHLIEVMGGCCKRCGFSDPRALQFDHVNGGGCFYARGNGNSQFELMLANLDQFQLLCANRNWIKREENKEYGQGYIDRVEMLRYRPAPYWK